MKHAMSGAHEGGNTPVAQVVSFVHRSYSATVAPHVAGRLSMQACWLEFVAIPVPFPQSIVIPYPPNFAATQSHSVPFSAVVRLLQVVDFETGGPGPCRLHPLRRRRCQSPA